MNWLAIETRQNAATPIGVRGGYFFLCVWGGGGYSGSNSVRISLAVISGRSLNSV